MKVISVEDEPPARRELRRLLEQFEDVTWVGEAGDLDTAKGVLQRMRPDVVFLDIMLGRSSGFDLLPHIDSETSVVFVTAYQDHAIAAFEANALDYLLKPVDPARLTLTIERLRELQRKGPGNTQLPRLYSTSRWIFLDHEGIQEFIQIENISHVEAEGGTSRLYTADGKSRLTSRSLLAWERRLDTGDFVRVHRSAIVNLKHVERVEPWFHYSYRIKVRGFAEPVVMSRRHASRIGDLLK